MKFRCRSCFVHFVCPILLFLFFCFFERNSAKKNVFFVFSSFPSSSPHLEPTLGRVRHVVLATALPGGHVGIAGVATSAAGRAHGPARVAGAAVRDVAVEGLETRSDTVAVLGRRALLDLREGVDTSAQRRLRGEHTGHCALLRLRRLRHEGRVEQDAVLGRRLLVLERAEEGLLGAEDLHRRGRVLGERQEAAGLLDQARADVLADHRRQVGGDGLHAVAEVGRELLAVLVRRHDLVAQTCDVVDVLVRDLRTHRHNRGLADTRGDLLADDAGEVRLGGLVAGAHGEDDLGVLDVVAEDLAELGEVPAVPFLGAHGVLVELLVKVVEEADGLHNHHVDLVGREAELVAVHVVGETQRRLVHLLLGDIADEVVHVGADEAHDVEDLIAVDDVDADLSLDGLAELRVQHAQLLRDADVDVLLEELLQRLAELTGDDSGGGLKGLLRGLELMEGLELGLRLVDDANEGVAGREFGESEH
eukprot:PhM_4_TR5606/c0_g1_i2/m.58742